MREDVMKYSPFKDNFTLHVHNRYYSIKGAKAAEKAFIASNHLLTDKGYNLLRGFPGLLVCFGQCTPTANYAANVAEWHVYCHIYFMLRFFLLSCMVSSPFHSACMHMGSPTFCNTFFCMATLNQAPQECLFDTSETYLPKINYHSTIFLLKYLNKAQSNWRDAALH
jgi:hypothetical protein